MQSRNSQFPLGTSFNFGSNNLLNPKTEFLRSFPLTPGNFEMLVGTPMLLLDNTDFLLL